VNILFDTNVILDVLLDREPFCDDAALLFDAVERSTINGYLCATTVTTVHYFVGKGRDSRTAIDSIRLLLEMFDVASVTRSVLKEALETQFSDFEDGVIYRSAASVNADGLVTRNPRDFVKARIPVYTPPQLVAALKLV
jgi:predicted nucleic acid-binding protein